MKNFLIENWYYLLCVCGSLLSILVILLKKTKIITKDTIFEQVVCQLPSFINLAENTGLDGKEKKSIVVSKAISCICELTGLTTLDAFEKYQAKLSKLIEDILSTPKKKEDLKNEK